MSLSTLEQLVVEASFSIWNEPPEELASRTRKKTIVAARAMITVYLYEEMGYKMARLAEMFEKNPVTPYRLKHEHYRKIEDWPPYKPNYDRLKAYMTDALNPKTVRTVEELRLEFAKKLESIETKYDTLKTLILNK